MPGAMFLAIYRRGVPQSGLPCSSFREKAALCPGPAFQARLIPEDSGSIGTELLGGNRQGNGAF